MYKVLVTGGCGFIGSNFILRLRKKKDWDILNIDKLTYSGNLDNLDSINSNYTFLQGDICDNQLIKKSIDDFQPNYIVNFAAESHVDRSIDSYSDFINTNILGTINLLDCSLKYFNSSLDKNFRFIHVSTDEVYGSLGNNGSFTEESTYAPSSPYSASKASSDHFVNAWNKTFGLPIIITNCSNNYGPFQFPEKLIPLMIINAINGRKLPIYGNGKNVRDWIHVYDHCDAIMKIIDKGDIGQKYNIGGNCEKTNLEIVETICDIVDSNELISNKGLSKNLIDFVEDRPGHDFRYAVNCNKISSSLGWSPKISFNKGIKDTVNWYLNNADWIKNINNKYSFERLGQIK